MATTHAHTHAERPPFDIAHEVGSREFLRPLIRLGLPARIRRLECADFSFLGCGPHGWARVGIERKTVSEMLGEASRHRFISRQLPKMLERYAFTFLVVEGVVRPSKEGMLEVGYAIKGGNLLAWSQQDFRALQEPYSHYLKRLLSLRVLTTLQVVSTANSHDTASFLHALYGWWQKPWQEHRSVLGVDTALARDGVLNELIVTDRTMRRRTFAGWPGIGWQKSSRVSNYFSSVKEAANATEQQWQMALGVKKGKVTARRIVAFLAGESEPEAKA